MSNPGQAALTIVGTVIGAYFGNPQLGLMLGSLAGSALFPTQLPPVRGPRLTDLKAQTSSLGGPIPLVYGTYALAGNVIWASDLIETKHEESAGGKGGGGGQEVTTYTYAQNLAIGLCEGPITSVRRIWANGRLIYDRSPQRTDETWEAFISRLATSDALDAIMTVYDGTQTTADPTMEAQEGVGNVPAYVGLAYVVFDNLQLEDYGNRAPNLVFEVAGDSTPVVDDQWSNSQLFPWLNALPPENPLNVHTYAVVGGSGYYSTMAAAIAADAPGQVEWVYGYSRDYSTPNYGVAPYSGFSQQPVEQLRIYQFINVEIVDVVDISYDTKYDFKLAFPDGTHYWWTGRDDSGAWSMHGVYWNGTPDYHSDVSIETQRVPRAPWNPADNPFSIPVPGTTDWYVVDGELQRAAEWSFDNTTTYKVLQKYDIADTELGPQVVAYPRNPVRPTGHPEYSDEDFWTAAYDRAVSRGEMLPGLTYGVDYPKTQNWAYLNEFASTSIDVAPVLVADIVADICVRCGLAAGEIDVSDLGTYCHGYAVTTVMSGRNAITPLMSFALFEAVESGATLKFIERGHAVAATLTADDLCAHEADSERPAAVEITRTQDVELPRTLRLTYAAPERDYQPGEQHESRLTTAAVNASDVQLPIAMDDTTALQLAQILLFDAWTARDGYTFAVDISRLALEPTDCVEIPVGAEVERVRIVSMLLQLPGVIQVRAVRDDATVLTSYAERGAMVISAPMVPSLPGPTDLVLLDLPGLRAQDNDAGYYAAGCGYLSGWSGFTVMTSFDAGTNYTNIASASTAATMGTLEDWIGGSPEEVTLRADSGSFSSATPDELDAGANVLAVGAHGRWELLQFETAALADGVWTLGGLRRGLRGTTANETTSLPGDRAVLMSGPGILRVPLAASLVNVEHLVKGVTLGTAVADAVAQTFASSGLSLQGDGLTFDENDNLTVDPDWSDLLIARQVFGP